jgi:hypothetical protein
MKKSNNEKMGAMYTYAQEKRNKRIKYTKQDTSG